ncbi:MAG: histidinol-phosphate transaminase [Chromatiaceae bacterium]|nr:histidinol-phosphate transaminase [Chromatiaceae bacterium]
MSKLIERLIRPEIQALAAYHVPDASGLIKLDAMENPYGWPAGLRRQWLEALQEVRLNRYPDPHGTEIQSALREFMDIPDGKGLLLGNGSDELIQMLALAVAQPGARILSVEPGFVMYRMIALFAGMAYVGVRLRAEDFSLDLSSVLAAMEKEQPAVVFLAYPNNPTGNLFDADAVARVIEAAPGLVVIDEAYAPFTDRSFMPRLGDWPNLMIMRTVSKMGLAGLRLGYLTGPSDWLAEIDKARLPYNINVLTQASTAFALRHRDVLDEQTRRIREERSRLYDELSGLDGIHPYPSEANFVLVRMPDGRAREIFESMKRAGVLVKNLDGAHPLLDDCLRVTVGRPEENAAFLAALESSL